MLEHESTQSANTSCGDPARREEEKSTNTSQLVTARLDPARREEDNEQQHTRQEEPGVIEYETISRMTHKKQTITCR